MAAAPGPLAPIACAPGPPIPLLPRCAPPVAVRAPLAKVPENALKFVVGIMLTSFGTFWGAEGAGVKWPGSDAALLVIVPVVALVSLGYAAWLRRARRVNAAAGPQAQVSQTEGVTS